MARRYSSGLHHGTGCGFCREGILSLNSRKARPRRLHPGEARAGRRLARSPADNFPQRNVKCGTKLLRGFRMAIASSTNIDSVLQEQRKFEPPAEFRENAHIKSAED